MFIIFPISVFITSIFSGPKMYNGFSADVGPGAGGGDVGPGAGGGADVGPDAGGGADVGPDAGGGLLRGFFIGSVFTRFGGGEGCRRGGKGAGGRLWNEHNV